MRHVYPVTDSSAGNINGTVNRFGFFPVGRLNTWHGGLHIEGNYPVNAIADGKIIAYRVSEEYKKATIDEVEYRYSDCFVLIEHCIKQPQKAQIVNNTANTTTQPSASDILLTYYSLYHHLLPHCEMGTDKIPEVFEVAAYKTRGKVKEWEKVDRKGTVLQEIPDNTIILLENRKLGSDKKWRQIKNNDGTSSINNGYLHLSDLDKTVTCSIKNYDAVTECEISVKAGTIIGHTGLYGMEKADDYWTTHVEVFTSNKNQLEAFINNTADNGTHQKMYLRIKTGTELIKAYPPYNIPSGYNIKILAKGTSYTKIEKHSLSKVVLKSDLLLITGSGASAEYAPRVGSLGRLNVDFDGKLIQVSKLIFEEKGVTSQVPPVIEKYKVRFEFAKGPELWVKNSLLGTNTEQTGLFTLTTDLTEFYSEEPTSADNEIMQDFQVLELHDIPCIKDANNQTWYNVTCEDKGENNTKVTRKGWIKEDANDTKQKISAYDWAEFGFKIINDDADEHFYVCGSSGFINTLCTEMDADSNKSLDQRELQQAFHQPFYARKLSRLICYHTSEWSYYLNKLPDIKAKIESKMDVEINKETDGTKRDEMKKLKADRLSDLEKRITALGFWNDIKCTTFPVGDPKVYHFHPIAFIDQMKKMSCFCYRDITVEAFEQIFGKGPWFKGKGKYSNMQTDCPNVYGLQTTNIVEALNNTMKKYGINTCLQKAHFLGQCGAETQFNWTIEDSDGKNYDPGTFKANHDLFQKYKDYSIKYGGSENIKKNYDTYQADYDTYENYLKELTKNPKLRATTEQINSKVNHDKYTPFLKDKNLYEKYNIYETDYNSYNNCIGCGNTTNGDGKTYRGRGLIQLTWKGTYQIYKTKTGVDCITIPELISNNLENSCDVSGWFWDSRTLDNNADDDDLLWISYRINGGGLNGFDERYRFTKLCIEKLSVKQCPEYEHLQLGEYSFETSLLSKSSWATNNNTGTKHTQHAKNKLTTAKTKYNTNPPK